MSVEVSAQPQTAESQTPPRSLVSDLIGIIVPLLILAVGVGFLVYSIVNRPEQETTPEEVVIPKVTTIVPTPFQENFEIDVDGVVVPHREIQLSTQVGGRIVHRADHCRTGKYVKAGEVLFEIDPTDFQLELKRLEQERQQARLRIRETKVDITSTRRQLELARRDVTLQENDVSRMTLLNKRGGVADSEVDRALRGQITAKNSLQTLRGRESLLTAQLESAKASVDLASTKIEVAKLNLERTRISAPMDGVVVEEMAEVDSFVQKGARLITIEDTSAVEVLCNLRTDQVAWLWRASDSTGESQAGDPYELPPVPADVVFDADGSEYIWKGVVSRYDGVGIDPRTRTIPCRILVADPTAVTRRRDEAGFIPEGATPTVESNASTLGGPAALVRGMFVDVRIHTPTSAEDLLRLPTEAVRPGGTLWVLADGRLEVRKASVAKTFADHALIHRNESDIELDDRVIVTPLPAATSGMELEEAVKQ